MNDQKTFNDITLDDLKAGLSDGTLVLVDVREADEYAAGHIQGALFNPLSHFDPEKLPPSLSGKKIIIYCRSGRRSITAMEKAQQAGRVDIDTHYSGGILGWLGAGGAVTTDN
ncbi:MAG: rhodanese-like domain-containing protein [Methylocystis sp.]